MSEAPSDIVSVAQLGIEHTISHHCTWDIMLQASRTGHHEHAPCGLQASSTRTNSVSSSQHGGEGDPSRVSSTAGGDGGEAKRAKAPLVFLNQLDQLLLTCYSSIFDT